MKNNADIDLRKFFGEWSKDYIPEPEICSHFSCGRTLTPQEKLFGDKCINHNHKPKAMSEILLDKYQDLQLRHQEAINAFAKANRNLNLCKHFLNKLADSPITSVDLKKQIIEFISTLNDG